MVELFPLAKLISFLYVPMYASVCTLRSELQIIVQKLRGIFALQISKNLIQKQKYDKIYFDSTLRYILVVPLNAN